MPGAFHDHIDKMEDVSYVSDVLDMWSFVEQAYARLSAEELSKLVDLAGSRTEHVLFLGFDANDEKERSQLGIARFPIEKMNRFSYFKGRELNSHMPMELRYRQMLKVFEPIRAKLRGAQLGVNQIAAILTAEP